MNKCNFLCLSTSQVYVSVTDEQRLTHSFFEKWKSFIIQVRVEMRNENENYILLRFESREDREEYYMYNVLRLCLLCDVCTNVCMSYNLKVEDKILLKSINIMYEQKYRQPWRSITKLPSACIMHYFHTLYFNQTLQCWRNHTCYFYGTPSSSLNTLTSTIMI